MRRYSTLGFYTAIGRYWVFPSIAMEKSDIALIRFELLPTLANASSFDPMSLGKDVCVVLMGSRADVNMIDENRAPKSNTRYLLKHLYEVDRCVCNFFRGCMVACDDIPCDQVSAIIRNPQAVVYIALFYGQLVQLA